MQQPDLDAPASDWLVYGDSLQQAGDPRGELISLVNAVNEGKSDASVRDAYVRKHWSTLLPGLPDRDGAYAFDWAYCAVRGVTIRQTADAEDLVRPLLASPLAASLRSITLVGASDKATVDLEPAMTLLAERAPKSCTTFAFVDERASMASMLVSRDFSPDENIVKLGPLEPFFGRATSLSLDVADSHQLDFGSFDASNLEAFALRCLRFADWEDADEMAGRFNDATWKKLKSFELRLVEEWVANIPAEDNPYIPVYSDDERYDEADDGDSEGCDWSSLGKLFENLAECPLERLALTSFQSANTLLPAIETQEWPHVRELDLSDSAIGDEFADWFVTNKHRFPKLEKLVLERVQMTAEGAGRIRAAGIGVQHSENRGAPSYRYVVGSE